MNLRDKRRIPRCAVLALLLASLPAGLFPATGEARRLTVTLDPARPLGEASPLLAGANTKWLFAGEAHHGRDNGLWSRNENRVNASIHDWLKISGLKLLRFGDGTNGDFFYWGWSILPWEERKAGRVATRWGTNDQYLFGLLEFLALADSIGAEGLVQVNYPLGILKAFYDPAKAGDSRTKIEIAVQQAANLVEFLNAPAAMGADAAFPKAYRPEYSLQKMPRGYFAWLRASLGRPKPAGVRFWEIGNEVDLFDRAGGDFSKTIETPAAVSCLDYTRDCLRFARAMKEMDASIKVGFVEWPCGKPKPEDLDIQLKVVKDHPGTLDFYIIHDYVSGGLAGRNPTFAFRGSKPVTRSFSCEGGRQILRLHAWGRAYFGDKVPQERGVPSRLEVSIDGGEPSQWTIDQNLHADHTDLVPNRFGWYERPVDLARGEHTLTLRMANDFYDGSMADPDRRGRDVFLDSVTLGPAGAGREIFYPEGPYQLFAEVARMEKKMAWLNGAFARANTPLFLAQTEGGVYPSTTDLAEALCNAAILMADARQGVALRAHFQLFGACGRAGILHSGDERSDAYHRTPTFDALRLFGTYFGETLIACTAPAAEKTLETASSDLDAQQTSTISVVQALASLRAGKPAVALLNMDGQRPAIITLTRDGRTPMRGTLRVLGTDSSKRWLASNEERPGTVTVRTLACDGTSAFELPPCSFAVFSGE